jgi:hypothetical protein
MRGWSHSTAQRIFSNLSNAESDQGADTFVPNATGFTSSNSSLSASQTYIYIAIRRGPMKVPTTGTSVFNPYTANLSLNTVVNTGFTPDFLLAKYRDGGDSQRWVDRLRGFASANSGTNPQLVSNSTAAETSANLVTFGWNNTGYVIGPELNTLSTVIYSFGRAPGFFDEVCYTGNGVAGRAISHNLGVTPELGIWKARTGASAWGVLPNTTGQRLDLNTDAAMVTGTPRINPWSASTFTANTGAYNGDGDVWVTYLFATCPGVSKVGSYTGNGTTQAIACGFTGGARFVLIKRTDDVGDWYYYDTARGMTVGTDPYLLLNSSNGEVATLGSVITSTGGFTVNAAILAAINTNAASYIFLAIA